MTPYATQSGRDLFAMWSETASRPDPSMIVIVATEGVVSGPLEAAIEWQFPWLHVTSRKSLTELLSEGSEPIQLLLLDLRLARDLEKAWSALIPHHPALKVAFVTEASGLNENSLIYRFDPRHLRGLLALDVRLDLFLSSLGIILNGGTYFASPLYAAPSQPGTPNDVGALPSYPERSSVATPSALNRLTQREREVLSHIARGSQNKNIAAVLGLSEHTVKIHIHNLINKLRVHNRTEAAAIYLRERAENQRALPGMLHQS